MSYTPQTIVRKTPDDFFKLVTPKANVITRVNTNTRPGEVAFESTVSGFGDTGVVSGSDWVEVTNQTGRGVFLWAGILLTGVENAGIRITLDQVIYEYNAAGALDDVFLLYPSSKNEEFTSAPQIYVPYYESIPFGAPFDESLKVELKHENAGDKSGYSVYMLDGATL
tara:strand:- start:8950 stop:9453 length:504 start_codon:yes stop_codon:yes gene_type:complete